MESTLIWYEGLNDWVPAVELSELEGVIIKNPQSIQQQKRNIGPPQKKNDSSLGNDSSHFYNANFQNQQKPKTWLVHAILTTIFCCLPLGIVGIVYASKVSSLYRLGDNNGALDASRNAGKWVKYGFISGLVFWILYFVFNVYIAYNEYPSIFE
jgi:hypothetical protein